MVEKKVLDKEFRALVEFARGSQVPTGFGMMNDDGQVDLDAPVELWVNSRMTHVFALAEMYGIPDTAHLVDHGVTSLARYFHDPIYGGWFSSIEPQPGPGGDGVPVDDEKKAYAQAFVILAATSALAAGHEEAREILLEALQDQEEKWRDADSPRVVEAWNRDFTKVEDYRGINANMHTVEALLAAADVLGNAALAERATKIHEIVYQQASENNWRVPEHYTRDWVVDHEYNADQPADPFRPYGVTPGHALEFARLMLHAHGSRQNLGLVPADWLLEGGSDLGKQGQNDGWAVDGQPGFVYTTDFTGEPVVRQRMHWVLCEAAGFAAVQARVLENSGDTEGAAALRAQAEEWWDYAQEYLVQEPGKWVHELDTENNPSAGTWSGKPDVYHAAQMVLLPRLPSSPTFAAALRDGLLDH